jgi:hypothetical protein
MTQATTQREIRVFLSSTFRDMDAERHYLVTRVFPEIRQICYQRMINFSEIDLRWGITEEAAHNGRTVQICLEEIERCRSLGIPPFFIGFLGERYGWVPQADDLAAYWQQSPDQRYAGLIRDALKENISVTELEIRFAFLAPRRMSPSLLPARRVCRCFYAIRPSLPPWQALTLRRMSGLIACLMARRTARAQHNWLPETTAASAFSADYRYRRL